MRLFKWLGVLLGSTHVALYFLVPDYFSVLDKVVPLVVGIPFMFVCGYLWPLLLFFAFAPSRFYEEPEAQAYIAALGRQFGFRRPRLSLRIVSLVLLWPFTIANFIHPYLFLKIINAGN